MQNKQNIEKWHKYGKSAQHHFLFSLYNAFYISFIVFLCCSYFISIFLYFISIFARPSLPYIDFLYKASTVPAGNFKNRNKIGNRNSRKTKIGGKIGLQV